AGAEAQYTTAVGNDANDGLNPNTPKATIRSVLETYNLGSGDIIFVDSGSYLLTTNIVVTTDDSGVTIQGPTDAGKRALLNRGNTNANNFVFQFTDADDVTINNLAFTGGNYGIYAAGGANSDRITIAGSEVFGNANTGIYVGTTNDTWLLSNNQIYSNQTGIEFYGAGDRAVGNHVFAQRGTGIYTSYSDTVARPEIVGNTVHDNGALGIDSSYWVLVQGNKVYGHSSNTGIYVYSDRALAIDNEVFRNATGINGSVGGVVRENRVYANGTGILLSGGGGAT